MAIQRLHYFHVDSGKNLCLFLSAKQGYCREAFSWEHLTSFALKQKQTAVPKIFVFVILTFLFLLLSAWCFKYIVSVFWKVWYHCTWWDWSFDLISDRIRSSPGRGKKGILWENQSFFYVPWTIFDILGSIPCPTHAPAFASSLPEVDMWTSKPRMTAEKVTQLSFTHNFCQRTAWGLIPIAVNGKLSNPLILIQQHAPLTMVGAVTVLFQGKLWHSGEKVG